MLVDTEELIGIGEIVDRCAYSKALVCNWAKRYKDFPRPVKVLKMGPIYRASEVHAWMTASGRYFDKEPKRAR